MPTMQTKCPHCGEKAIIRDSWVLSDTCRKIKAQCQDPDCGFVGQATISFDTTISPSAKPNPQVNLPLSRHVNRNLVFDSMKQTA
ncbi:MAG: ogr/Delta-like zinc finger family protein [Candidatus Sedimenticola sp. (ex Thyasira tokunagai)]